MINAKTPNKKPYIKDLIEFAKVADYYGYSIQGDYCIKRRYFYGIDIDVLIKVNIQTGEIKAECFEDDISKEVHFDDLMHLLKDIDYLIELRSPQIQNKGEICLNEYRNNKKRIEINTQSQQARNNERDNAEV